MGVGRNELAAATLRILADLAPVGARSGTVAVDTSKFVWVSPRWAGLVADRSRGGPQSLDTAEITQIVLVSRLREHTGMLRLGWLWVAGGDNEGSTDKDPFFPLVSVPVAFKTPSKSFAFGPRVLVAMGDAELTDRILVPGERSHLEMTLADSCGETIANEPFGPDGSGSWQLLNDWAIRAAAAAEMPTDVLRLPHDDLRAHRRSDQRHIVVGAALYFEPPRAITPRADSILSWVDDRGIGDTAFASIYVPNGLVADTEVPADDVLAPLVLSPDQRRCVAAARTAPITTVSGPPGAGKSHALAAIAADAVVTGSTVLMAAKSDAAVDVLVGMLRDRCGISPVVFGSSSRRAELADALADGLGYAVGRDELTILREQATNAINVEDAVRAEIAHLLELEQLANRGDTSRTLAHRSVAPNWFDADADHAEIAAQLEALDTRLHDDHDGWIARRRERNALDDLHQSAGSVATFGQLLAALTAARSARALAVVMSSGGISIGHSWDNLTDAEKDSRRALARFSDASMRSPEHRTAKARKAAAALARGLRSGRAQRRQLLDGGYMAEITTALPLWIGTLRDIDELLPRQAGLFDLLVLDEAAQVDQISLAPALLRSKRAVVAGDPRQLRHVSFTSDADTDAAHKRHALAGFDEQVGRVDVRRDSAFDVAAASSSSILLSEHYRCVPHLIAFSARHFYDDRLTVATRHPANETADRIDLVRVTGDRAKRGANAEEVRECLAAVRRLAKRGHTSIGIITPFRPQADAIEAAALKEFDADFVDQVNLRVGTVHGFQGAEADAIVLSLAVAASSEDGRAFMEDAQLFNVAITRARHEMIVITSLPDTTGGLVGKFFSHCDDPPEPVANTTMQPWTRTVADLATSLKIPYRTGYPVGRHALDLVLGTGGGAIGVECTIHPDGPDAHIERHQQLQRAGWRIIDAFETRWKERLPALAVELRAHVNEASNRRVT